VLTGQKAKLRIGQGFDTAVMLCQLADFKNGLQSGHGDSFLKW
jgi:hypothetical protein